jgi:ketosteroid isomerase-like protein
LSALDQCPKRNAKALDGARSPLLLRRRECRVFARVLTLRDTARAMSQENMDLVRRAFQAFNDRDLDALAIFVTDDVVWRHIGGVAALMETEHRGRDAVEQWFADWVETVQGRSEIEAVFEVDDRVVVITRTVGAGGTSGAPATIRTCLVISFRNRRISAVDDYYEVSEALEALGLSEQDAHADS